MIYTFWYLQFFPLPHSFLTLFASFKQPATINRTCLILQVVACMSLDNEETKVPNSHLYQVMRLPRQHVTIF